MLAPWLAFPPFGKLSKALDTAFDTVERRALDPRQHPHETRNIMPARLARSISRSESMIRHAFNLSR